MPLSFLASPFLSAAGEATARIMAPIIPAIMYYFRDYYGRRPRPPPPPPPAVCQRSVILNVCETTEESTVVHSNAPSTYVNKTDEIRYISRSQNSPDKKFDEENFSKNMLNKSTNDAKNMNKNIQCEKFLGHNIYKEDSSSSESNEKMLINRNDENIVHISKKPSKHKRKSKHPGLKSAQNITDKKFDLSDQHQTESNSNPHSDDSVIFASSKVTKAIKNVTDQVQDSRSSNLYPEIDIHPLLSDDDKSSSCSDEGTYKQQLHETLKKDIYDSKENRVGSSVIGSPQKIKEGKPIDSMICRVCEENHVNTRAHPCNHSFLCVNCAVLVFRVYKKCVICLADVKEFLQFAS